jgi:hypothetical protein
MIQSTSNQTILSQVTNQPASQVPSSGPNHTYAYPNSTHAPYMSQPIPPNRQCSIHHSQPPPNYGCQYPIIQNSSLPPTQSYPSNQISAPPSSYNQTQYNYPPIPASQQIQSQTNNMPYVVIQNPQPQPQVQQTSYNHSINHYQSPPQPLIHPIQQDQHNSLTKNFEQQSCFNIPNSPTSISLNNNISASIRVPSPSSLSTSSSSVNTNNSLQYNLSQPFSNLSVSAQPHQQVSYIIFSSFQLEF